jgi:hypothetical protein
MSTSQPAYPTQRAFVVQVHGEADLEQGEIWGRVEHIVSGQARHFETVETLMQFIVQTLKSSSH